MVSDYIIKIGEIALKGKNRHLFEKQLKTNITGKLRGTGASVSGGYGRFYLSPGNSNPEQVEEALKTTFGIIYFAPVTKIKKEMDQILQKSIAIAKDAAGQFEGKRFKVKARRIDKNFPHTSYEIACQIGNAVLEALPGLSVDVHNPDWVISVEIRETAILYGAQAKGPGGLPVGIAGKGLLLLSGGIDSPVAGYMMAKRGLSLDAVYYHAYPYTSDQAKEKVIRLGEIIGKYLGDFTLSIVPFTKAQLLIKEKAREEETTLLMRACMVKIAEILIEKTSAASMVTGESLSQVASQTLNSLRFTGSMTNYPVFRPLIGMDKEEIIERARAIGTFETSILPYEDCCTIFSPKHPLIKPDSEKLQDSFSRLEITGALHEAADGIEKIHIVDGKRQ